MWRICWLTTALAVVAVLGGCGGEDEEPQRPAITGPLPEKGSDLFVLRGPASASGGRIEIDTDVAEWFTERPRRKAGVAAADELVGNWEDYGYTSEPPNAALAGDQIDAEVELTEPEATESGLSFAYSAIRGEVAEGEDESVSVFIDSSEWDTDMHVYVETETNTSASTSGWCDKSQSTILTDPQINSSPANWSYYPTDSITLTEDDQEIFTAASKSGTTSFSVTYDVSCESGGSSAQIGQVKFSGKVPDNLNPDSFDCSAENMHSANPADDFECLPDEGGGYHVDAHATLVYGSSDHVNDQITD